MRFFKLGDNPDSQSISNLSSPIVDIMTSFSAFSGASIFALDRWLLCIAERSRSQRDRTHRYEKLS